MGAEFVYRIVRSARRTVSVTVRENDVVVRAPLGMSDAKISSFVGEHAGWIEKQLSRFSCSAERFGAVRAGKSALVDGKEVPLFCGAERNALTQDGIFLKDLRSMQSLFMKEKAFLLVEKTAAISRTAGLYPEDVSVRDFKARWGSCDARGAVKLNWRLSMLPYGLQKYVIVHELCHLAHLDHSPAFWAEVGRHITDWHKRKKMLKDYSFLTLLYR